MSFSFADAKKALRRTVQSTFGVQAFYKDASISVPVEIRARFHNKISKPFGDLVDGAGYAEVIEGIDRIVLIPEDLDGLPVTLVRNGEITFPDLMPRVKFLLDTKVPHDGPLEEAWMVTREWLQP